MKKLHIEFDLIVTDKTAEELMDTPEICLTDNILEAFEATNECEYIENFKIHNLASDAEGEARLTVLRKDIVELCQEVQKTISQYKGTALSIQSAGIKNVLWSFFGSKCLPDACNVASNVASKEPKPAEPKFKYNIGQKVKSVFANEILTIKEHCGRVGHDNVYKVEEYAYTWNECELRPCTEPKNKRHVSVKEACEILGVDESEATKLVRSEPIETCTETCTDDCSSPDHFVVKHEMVDNIKDGFKNHNRLHIAAILAAGMLASEVRCYPVDRALELADKLIAECEKGDNNAQADK